MYLYAFLIILILLLIVNFWYYNYLPKIATDSAIVENFNGQPVKHLIWHPNYKTTYRLLELVLIERQFIQPIYIMPDKYSYLNNLKTSWKDLTALGKIKNKLFQKYPDTTKLILPTVVIFKMDYDDQLNYVMKKLYLNGKIKDMYNNYGYYLMLSKFYNIPLEICAECDDTHMEGLIRSYMVPDDNMIGTGKIMPNWDTTNIHPNDVALFRYLRFPVMNYNSYDIYVKAREYGYDDYLKMTRYM